MSIKKVSVETVKALNTFPYFVLRKEGIQGYSDYTKELQRIKQYYLDYKNGCSFVPIGKNGDYVASMTRFKKAATLIKKEARFMFSQIPDFNVQSINSEEEDTQVKEYQTLIDKVLEKNNISRKLMQGAKDCFVGKRIAILVDYSEDDGILVHFYNSLQFYYETDYGSDRVTKFISFENVVNSKSMSQRKVLVNRYEVDENGTVKMSSVLYKGNGEEEKRLIEPNDIGLDYIPVSIVINDGLLEDVGGVSEMEDLEDYEKTYSTIANADVDAGIQNMNPKTYTVDMDPKSTSNLPTGAGAYWDLRHNQNMNEPKPSVGTISPNMQHVDAVKTTLSRIDTAMHEELDVPNINEETLVGTVTSGKSIKALYYPLSVRCDEKMMSWDPALKSMLQAIIDIALLNEQDVKERYFINELVDVQYNLSVSLNYAILDDEIEEKSIDLQEIAANARSRMSYIKKWRKEELRTDNKRQNELMQIAIELNMFDTMSMNTQVQNELNVGSVQEEVDKNVEGAELENN